MDEEIPIKIVSPGRDPVKMTATQVSIYASDGYMEIYPNHAPLVFMLGVGMCEIIHDKNTEKFVVFNGIGHFIENELTLCPDYFELPEEVDVERAQQALFRANQRLLGKDPQVPKRSLQSERAIESKARSMVRLRLKGIVIDE
jgi:F-type H+-transporting ATPase subunit epsilon